MVSPVRFETKIPRGPNVPAWQQSSDKGVLHEIWIGSDVVNFYHPSCIDRPIACHCHLPRLARLLVRKLCNGTNRFFGLSGHRQRIHDEIQFIRDAQHERERVKGETVGVLEEHQPLNAVLLPLLRHAVRKHERVNVAVPVRFRLHRTAFVVPHHAGIIVVQRRYTKALLHNRNLALFHSKVIVLLEEIDGFLIGIARGHDAEGQLATLRKFFLDSQNVFNVVLQIARLASHLGGKPNLSRKRKTTTLACG